MKQSRFYRLSYGFTLIELIVATAIVMGFAGFGTASYLNFNEKQVLEQGAKTIKNNLRFAQQKAVSGEKDASLCSTKPLAGWCFSPDSDTSSGLYRLYGSCADLPGSGVTPTVIPFPDTPLEFQLPKGINVETRASNNPSDPSSWQIFGQRVLFRPLGKGALIMGNDASNNTVSFSTVAFCLDADFPSLGTNNKYVIRVDVSGEIIDDGFPSNGKCPWDT